jgi:hypothetical protein
LRDWRQGGGKRALVTWPWEAFKGGAAPRRREAENRASVAAAGDVLHGIAEVLEHRADIVAQQDGDGDEGERNAGRDQAVFDRGDAAQVARETANGPFRDVEEAPNSIGLGIPPCSRKRV